MSCYVVLSLLLEHSLIKGFLICVGIEKLQPTALFIAQFSACIALLFFSFLIHVFV